MRKMGWNDIIVSSKYWCGKEAIESDALKSFSFPGSVCEAHRQII